MYSCIVFFSYFHIFHKVFHVICDIHMCAIKRDMLFAHFCIFSCDTYMEENTGKLEPGIQHNVQVVMCIQSSYLIRYSFPPKERLDP